MKFLLLLLLVSISLSQIESSTIILVRHAEKALDGSKNPPLTNVGRMRANRLKDILVDAELTTIFSTNYSRTINTVKPLADTLGIEILNYNPRTANEIISYLEKNKNQKVLISGHSNTLKTTIEQLGGPSIGDILDNEYNNLFILTKIKIDGKLSVNLTRLRY
jgi:broad specificity phosphatase PhoE